MGVRPSQHSPGFLRWWSRETLAHTLVCRLHTWCKSRGDSSRAPWRIVLDPTPRTEVLLFFVKNFVVILASTTWAYCEVQARYRTSHYAKRQATSVNVSCNYYLLKFWRKLSHSVTIVLFLRGCWSLLDVFLENVNRLFCLNVIWLVGQASPLGIERFKAILAGTVRMHWYSHTSVGQSVRHMGILVKLSLVYSNDYG